MGGGIVRSCTTSRTDPSHAVTERGRFESPFLADFQQIAHFLPIRRWIIKLRVMDACCSVTDSYVS